MAYTDIDKPSDYFNTKLYTGTGATQSITGVGFQPDWVWIKKRNGTTSHTVTDSVRGVNKQIFTNEVEAEESYTSVLTAFDSDGFSLSTAGLINASSDTYVAWNWKAGTSFTNDASSTGIGTIDSTGSVNTDAGFSIISYTGTGSVATVAHGLGAAPAVLIHKKRTTSAEAWSVFHQSVGITKRMILSSTEAATADASPQPDWNNVLPTSSVFTIGTSPRTNATEDYICYAFAEKKGYSKFGSYTGNGNADGTFVYTGMKPSFVMIKRTDSATGGYWVMFDNKRNTFNVMDKYLFAQANDAEDTSNLIDFYSNGFRPIVSNLMHNGSGASYIYMCFAENPFVTSTGVPATAR
jgi:hypothetical protein